MEELLSNIRMETQTMKKENEELSQTLRIKEKMLDDQNDTIKKLKQDVSLRVYYIYIYKSSLIEKCVECGEK